MSTPGKRGASRERLKKTLSELGLGLKRLKDGNVVVVPMVPMTPAPAGAASAQPAADTTATLPSESVRKAEVIAHATEALDGQTNALRWLQRPHPSLGDRAPLNVLTQGTPEEIEQVDELLYAVEYGMYA